MPNEVTLSVRSQLAKIVEELDKIDAKAKDVSSGLKDAGKTVGEGISEQAKKTATFMENLTNMGRRAADQLKGDFKSLVAINAVSQSLKVSEQFKGSVREALQLNDAIRKLGTSFGIAGKDFASFQSKMLKGLGDMGLSSEAGSNVLQGLAGTGVKGQDRILAYAQQAGQLASISNTKGTEGDIAKGMAETLRARGVDVNSARGADEMKSLAEDLRRAYNQTGKSPQELLGSMRDIFTNMSQDFRKTMTSRGLVNLAAASQTAGPNSTKFLEDYLGKSPVVRKAFEAQGGRGVITNQGIDVDKFRTFSKAILARVGGDPRLAAQTLGLSEDAAEGFVRLSQSLDQVKASQEAMAKSTGSVEDQYKASLGAGEAFKASINKVKSLVSGPLSAATQGVTNLLSSASQSKAGAAGVVAGGGVLAALLAGYGLKGVGKGLGGAVGGLAKAGAAEAITGREVVPVYVTNASEVGAGGAIGGAAEGILGKGKGLLGKAAGVAGKGLGVLAAGAAGYEVGSLANEQIIEKHTQGRTEEGFEGNAVERLIFKIEKLLNTQNYQQFEKSQRVIVELNKRDLKETKQPTRGASH